MPPKQPKQIAYDPMAHRAELPSQFNGMAEEVIAPDSALQFEQRVLRPSQFPVLDLRDKKGRGEVATHRMMNAEVGLDDSGVPTPIAYPSVVYDEKTKTLRELAPQAAFDHALKTGEFRKFGTPAEAGAYAEGLYKKHWGAGDDLDAFTRQLQQGTK